MKLRTFWFPLILSFGFLAACQSSAVEPVSQSVVEPTATFGVPTENTPEPSSTATAYVLPTQVGTATPFVYDGLDCYSEDLPYAFAESPAVVGWKYFAEREQLEYQVIYFPDTCSQDDIEDDIEHLFFTTSVSEKTTLLLLADENFGSLGDLNSHLHTYDFWAMGPEDYPMVMKTSRSVNPNIIIFRTDRLYGEGHEGNEILGLMVGLGEHEYIHTVQARNNPDLAEMIWSDAVYQAVIERYANLNNNSGSRYYMASYSYLSLIQMIDGLNEMGELQMAVETVLGEMGYSTEDFLAHPYVNYDSHLEGLLISVAGQNYLTHLEKNEMNALLIVSRTGLGDIVAYELARTLYDRYVDAYNLWYYGSSEDQYLPESFDLLFNPN